MQFKHIVDQTGGSVHQSDGHRNQQVGHHEAVGNSNGSRRAQCSTDSYAEEASGGKPKSHDDTLSVTRTCLSNRRTWGNKSTKAEYWQTLELSEEVEDIISLMIWKCHLCSLRLPGFHMTKTMTPMTRKMHRGSGRGTTCVNGWDGCRSKFGGIRCAGFLHECRC